MTILNLDDPGASTKQYEQYACLRLPFGLRPLPTPNILNYGNLKKFPLWRGWGPYRELAGTDWYNIFALLRRHKAAMTVGVTANWVEDTGELTPFPEKYPESAAALKEGQQEGLIEIANHGLTHCVLKDKAFLPQSFSSNRGSHREFWPWLSTETHRDHINQSQQILSSYFDKDIVTFIPPGNVWSEETEKHALAAGLRYLTANLSTAKTKATGKLQYLDSSRITAFHDRDIAFHGVSWFNNLLRANPGPYNTIREHFESDNPRQN